MNVPIIAYVFYKRRIDRFEFIAAGVAIVGIGLLSLQDSLTINIGDVLSIMCAVGFAFDIFYTNVFVKTEDALALTIEPIKASYEEEKKCRQLLGLNQNRIDTMPSDAVCCQRYVEMKAENDDA